MAFRQHVSALFTDLYEVTMAQAYWAQGMSGTAVFETFFRKLPQGRSYLMAAGLVDVLDFLEGLRFVDKDLQYLKSTSSKPSGSCSR
jgi:nicotinate phosphoribosyltransferase